MFERNHSGSENGIFKVELLAFKNIFHFAVMLKDCFKMHVSFVVAKQFFAYRTECFNEDFYFAPEEHIGHFFTLLGLVVGVWRANYHTSTMKATVIIVKVANAPDKTGD